MARFHFYCPEAFEPWDYRNPDTQGIGGSETAVVEMAWRLAQRGHRVDVMGPIPQDCPRRWRGTTWHPLEAADFTAPGIWVLSRCPTALDSLPHRDTQRTWLICQDEDYPRQLTLERLNKLDRLVALCTDQADAFRVKYPDHAARVYQSSNGIRPELVQEALAAHLPRNPKALLYPSSPDRGLNTLLGIFRRAREYVPDLELHVCYGFDNIDKVVAKLAGQARGRVLESQVGEIKAALQQPGIVWHGRMGQPDLYRLWTRMGLWCYPVEFRETNCITCQEAQALGAIPITCPVWAVGEYTLGGSLVEGRVAHDALVQARLVMQLVKWACDPERQEQERQRLMPLALERFSYERAVDQWEAWAHEAPEAGAPR